MTENDTDLVLSDDADAAFMLLAAAVVERARTDSTHQCNHHCKHPKQCQRRKFQARLFLRDVHAGRGAYWVRAWLDMAAQQSLS